MTEDVSVSGIPTHKNNLTEAERILVIALLSLLSILIICLIILITLVCRKNMKPLKSSYLRSNSRMNPGSPVLTGNHPRLSVSRLNTRYSDVDFQRSRDVIDNTDMPSSQMYFKNQTFRSDSDDVIENGRVSEILYDTPRTSPVVRPKFYWWLVCDISQNRENLIFIDDCELITHKLSHFTITTGTLNKLCTPNI